MLIVLAGFSGKCCSFCISTCSFLLQFYVIKMVSFLKFQEPTSASFKLFFYSFLSSLSSQYWRELESYSGLDSGSGECGNWFELLSRPLNLHPSAIKLSHFLIIHVFTAVALCFPQEFLLLCIHKLTRLTCARGLAFGLSQPWHAFLTKLNHF